MSRCSTRNVEATAFAIRAAPRGVLSVAASVTTFAFGSTDEVTLSWTDAAVSPGTRRELRTMVVKRWPASILLCLSIAGSASAGVAAGGPRVTYDGPTGNVTGPLTLTAEAKGNGARIAAVTFVVDGAPRGSDTTAPYSLGLNPALVRGGRHTVRVVAVDNLGRRASSSVATLVINRPGYRPGAASPEAGLADAIRTLC